MLLSDLTDLVEMPAGVICRREVEPDGDRAELELGRGGTRHEVSDKGFARTLKRLSVPVHQRRVWAFADVDPQLTADVIYFYYPASSHEWADWSNLLYHNIKKRVKGPGYQGAEV